MNMEEALGILKQKGYKYTKKRKDILSYFDQEDGYRSAKDLLHFMEPAYPGISFDTIYRNLHLFDELAILESTELEGEKHFRISCVGHHHHHFICKQCGITKEIDTCPMDNVKGELGGFQIEDHKFEIYGRCPSCQAS